MSGPGSSGSSGMQQPYGGSFPPSGGGFGSNPYASNLYASNPYAGGNMAWGMGGQMPPMQPYGGGYNPSYAIQQPPQQPAWGMGTGGRYSPTLRDAQTEWERQYTGQQPMPDMLGNQTNPWGGMTPSQRQMAGLEPYLEMGDVRHGSMQPYGMGMQGRGNAYGWNNQRSPWQQYPMQPQQPGSMPPPAAPNVYTAGDLSFTAGANDPFANNTKTYDQALAEYNRRQWDQSRSGMYTNVWDPGPGTREDYDTKMAAYNAPGAAQERFMKQYNMNSQAGYTNVAAAGQMPNWQTVINNAPTWDKPNDKGEMWFNNGVQVPDWQWSSTAPGVYVPPKNQQYLTQQQAFRWP
jgi:hypothetical protein